MSDMVKVLYLLSKYLKTINNTVCIEGYNQNDQPVVVGLFNHIEAVDIYAGLIYVTAGNTKYLEAGFSGGLIRDLEMSEHDGKNYLCCEDSNGGWIC